MTIRVGIFVTNQHPIGGDLKADQEGQIELVRFARDHGWDSVWVGQHFLSDTMAMPQPVPLLARLVPESGDMSLGMGVCLIGLHNPVEVAETFASLDVMSGGRLVFGVGLGYRDVEFDAFGIPRQERLRRFVENLKVIEALWTEEKVDADLEWCRLDGATLHVRPLQRPRPPIWMAADADRAVARAARMADTWLINPHATVETIGRQLDLFRAARSDAGRPPVAELPAMREVYCARDRTAALEAVRPYLEPKYKRYAAWGQDGALPDDETFDMEFEALVAGRFVLGSPDDCLAELLPWRDRMGVDSFIFRTHWSGMSPEMSRASMELLTNEVLPVLRDGGS
jgi:alkanesulfonate monooxygenase SsuD/methylene tetrahydromethanopterin reductase-like flavin-dependent oxidoreductase (luciferase family)